MSLLSLLVLLDILQWFVFTCTRIQVAVSQETVYDDVMVVGGVRSMYLCCSLMSIGLRPATPRLIGRDNRM